MNNELKKNPYQEFIYLRTYSRWIERLGRRETWEETVDRVYGYYADQLPNPIPTRDFHEFKQAFIDMYNLEVMPSMRSAWTAGEALERENIAAYNCAYTPIDRLKSFSEVLYIMLCGTGVGFSTEEIYINQLPVVPSGLGDVPNLNIIFEDSKFGWADGFKTYLEFIYEQGIIPSYDLSLIRPKGARLKTFGGRASGAEPLQRLLEFTKYTLLNAQGRKLNSLEVYDIICMIADTVVVGGVRRSATISLSDLKDTAIRDAKQGNFWEHSPYRALANNSAVYLEKPSEETFQAEWKALSESGNGERGIVNREGLIKTQDALGRGAYLFGVNPCGEIILRPRQFCNLSEVVVRPNDTLTAIKEKVRSAVILGAIQSTFTKFNFLDEDWKINCEDERLLGVSLTGVRDHFVLGEVSDRAKRWLYELKHVTVQHTFRWSTLLSISMPAAITTVKPSGTVSQLVGTASGIHPRYADYYIRRVRVADTDPLAKLLADAWVPNRPCAYSSGSIVFDFYQESPVKGRGRTSFTAIDQLEYWKMYKECWTDHNPSVTIFVEDGKWDEVGEWVYKNFDLIGGLSFFPETNDSLVSDQNPFQEITEQEYKQAAATFPHVDFSLLSKYELEDVSMGGQTMACSGDSCSF